MDGYDKGNGQASGFRPSSVPRPSFTPATRPRTTPPPLNRSSTASGTLRTEASRSVQTYGIRRAVELLRRLPPGDRAVLVEVVKMALESANVQVESIIEDATKRGTEIDARIAVLRLEVSQREEEISTRREEIANLETEQDEISRVKTQLTAANESPEQPIEEKAPSNDDAVVSATSDIDVTADLGPTLTALEQLT